MITAPKSVLTVHNHHVPGCGQPPHLETDSKLWTGYFEDSHGEQWVIQVDREMQTAMLFGGDCGWQNPIRITEGRIDGDVILGGDVRRWMAVAWEAATGTPLFQMPFDVLLQKVANHNPHDTDTTPSLDGDMIVAGYIQCGALQDAADEIAEAIDYFEDTAEEIEVPLTRMDLQVIAAAIDACLRRATVPTD